MITKAAMTMTTKSVTNAKSNNIIDKNIYTKNNWEFTFQKSKISSTIELDYMLDSLKLQNIPEITYGNNMFQMTYQANDFTYKIIPQDSLSYTNYNKLKQYYLTKYDNDDDDDSNSNDKTQHLKLIKQDHQEALELEQDLDLDNIEQDNKLSIQLNSVNVIPTEVNPKNIDYMSNHTTSMHPAKDNPNITILGKISDWTFSTPYKGTILYQPSKKNIFDEINIGFDFINIDKKENKNQKKRPPYVEITTEKIPLDNLGPNNPILYYNDLSLFDDELQDRGLGQSNFKFRVMNDCFFGLLRFYLRIDNILFRIYDTRFYHDFKTDYIIREFTWKQSTYEQLRKKGFKFTIGFHTDPNQSDIIYNELETKLEFNDKIVFK